MAARTPEEIRSSIESNRTELVASVERLRGEVAYLTDWRGHIERHRNELMLGAAVVGLARRRSHDEPPPAPPARLNQPSSERGSAPTPIRPGPV